MAVVQISRIQQRRGRKKEGSGFPQLASGEIGWAVDTQELYIGNGSVSEGAPYVGNTQILTEHVKILEFAETYQYKKSDPSINYTVARTLQERLDNYVSVKEFGATGTGDTDDTVAIQNALDQLFLVNRTTEDRVVLFFEPGEYKITSELRIPPYAHLVGSGIDSTIIHLSSSSSSGSVMRPCAGDSVPGNYVDFSSMKSLERPRYISIEKMTLQTSLSDSILRLENTDRLTIDYVKFVGTYLNGTSAVDDVDLFIHQSGIYIRSTSSVLKTENIFITNCQFTQTGYGIYSECDHDNISINNCTFTELFDGVSIGGTSSQAVKYTTPLISRDDISTVDNTIRILNHPYVDNQLVVYNSGLISQAIGGLINLSGGDESFTFYVIVQDANYFGLSSEPNGTLIQLLTTGNVLQTLTSENRTDTIDPNNISLATNLIHEENHGYAPNTQVHYSIGLLPIIAIDPNDPNLTPFGLQDTGRYYVKVFDNNNNIIQLRKTPGGAPLIIYDKGFDLQSFTSEIGIQGAINSKISHCYFDLIDRHGIWVRLGEGNLSSSNNFINVGNGFNGFSNALFPNIKYDTSNNLSINDYFERNSKLKSQATLFTTAFVPPIKSSGLVIDATGCSIKFYETSYGAEEKFRLPIDVSSTYVIDYVLNLTDPNDPTVIAIRTGKLHITINITSLTSHINDDFSYTGNPNVELVKFGVGDLSTTEHTVPITIYNPTGNGDGQVNFSYRTLSQ